MALVLRMAVWFSSQAAEVMEDVYGNDHAVVKYRTIVKALIEKAKEAGLTKQAQLLNINILLGVLQPFRNRNGPQKEEAKRRLNDLKAYVRADTQEKREKLIEEEDAERKVRQAARAAGGGGSSSDPAPAQAPTTAQEELAADLQAWQDYTTQGPPAPAAPMTDAQLLEKYNQDLAEADAQLEAILAHNAEYAKDHPFEEREIADMERYYQLKVITRQLLIAKEAVRLLLLAPERDSAAINKAHDEVTRLSWLQSMHEL